VVTWTGVELTMMDSVKLLPAQEQAKKNYSFISILINFFKKLNSKISRTIKYYEAFTCTGASEKKFFVYFDFN
jgi:hypothetical protein